MCLTHSLPIHIKQSTEDCHIETTAFITDICKNISEDDNCKIQEIKTRALSAVDCTTCGNCCKTLIINVEDSEVSEWAAKQQISEQDFISNNLETSAAGKYYINSIPCRFLSGNICTVYENRFNDCRNFPHVYKQGWQNNLPQILMYAGICPIVQQIVEGVKHEFGFYK